MTELGGLPRLLFILVGFFVSSENVLCTFIMQYNSKDFCGLFLLLVEIGGVLETGGDFSGSEGSL